MFTARYGLSPYITYTRLVFKGLKQLLHVITSGRARIYVVC